jgi:hypothetical protein
MFRDSKIPDVKYSDKILLDPVIIFIKGKAAPMVIISANAHIIVKKINNKS